MPGNRFGFTEIEPGIYVPVFSDDPNLQPNRHGLVKLAEDSYAWPMPAGGGGGGGTSAVGLPIMVASSGMSEAIRTAAVASGGSVADGINDEVDIQNALNLSYNATFGRCTRPVHLIGSFTVNLATHPTQSLHRCVAALRTGAYLDMTLAKLTLAPGQPAINNNPGAGGQRGNIITNWNVDDNLSVDEDMTIVGGIIDGNAGNQLLNKPLYNGIRWQRAINCRVTNTTVTNVAGLNGNGGASETFFFDSLGGGGHRWINCTAFGTGARTVLDGSITNGLKTVTSNTMAFVAGDVGRSIYGSGIGDNRIESVVNATTAVLVTAATATTSNLKITITDHATGFSANSSEDVIWYGCLAYECGAHGFTTWQSNMVTRIACRSWANHSNAARFEHAYDFADIGCQWGAQDERVDPGGDANHPAVLATKNWNNGLNIKDSHRGRIVGCGIYGNRVDGIEFNGGYNVSITGCMIVGNGVKGIDWVDSPENGYLSSNVAIDPATNVIRDNGGGNAVNNQISTPPAVGRRAPINAVPINVPLVLSGSNGIAWTAMPLAATEFLGATRNRTIVNLADAVEARIVSKASTAGAAGATLKIQYSTDESTWVDLTPTVSIAGTASIASAWGLIPAAARADVTIRILGENGNAVANPAWGTILLQVR